MFLKRAEWGCYITKLLMIDDTAKLFIKHLCAFLPERRRGKRGPKPIPKKKLIQEYFKLVKYGLGWRQIKYASTVHAYIKECQRRGYFKKYLEDIISEELQYRQQVAIVDACDLEGWDVSRQTSYSYKNHDTATKLTLEITPNYIPIFFTFSGGKHHDISEWKKIIHKQDKLPYKVYLDKGYESYKLRKTLRKINCQIKIQPKDFTHNHKKGPHFQWSEEDAKLRPRVESLFAWIQSFKKVHFRYERSDMLFHAFVITSLAYYTLMRKT